MFFEKTSRNSKKLATYLEQLRLMSDFEDGARIKDGQGPEVEKSEAEGLSLLIFIGFDVARNDGFLLRSISDATFIFQT